MNIKVLGLDDMKSMAKMAQTMRQVFDLLPICPDCKKQNCSDWALKFIGNIRQYHTGPFGTARMLAALVEQAGGEVILSSDKIQDARQIGLTSFDVTEPEKRELILFRLKSEGYKLPDTAIIKAIGDEPLEAMDAPRTDDEGPIM